MKVITIKQPWATLIALGEKKFETRSWATKHRGPLAIHAGKSIDRDACEYIPIKEALEKHGISNYKELPTGVILATTILTNCHKVPEEHTVEGIEFGKMLRGDEVYFGNYEAGRFAWELSEIQVIKPVPTKGQLSLWNWDEGSK
ncbi:ASCH domain-containing protein [Solibacillus sp.]|uniref:ASCH domain-containing protein n=1 Tax=Solibacillus sp. TaxID=1909654 RepID=UPI003314AF14